MSRKIGMNRHQKAAHRAGEPQVSKQDIPRLIELSQSADAGDRELAAQYLCPCHVRTRIPEVWEALYRMLEDPEPRLRRAAWHTLEDGGRPDDPALDAIFERARCTERDPRVLSLMRQVMGKREDPEVVRMRAAVLPTPRTRGKCDFCGQPNQLVQRDLHTMIPIGSAERPALICAICAKVSA